MKNFTFFILFVLFVTAATPVLCAPKQECVAKVPVGLQEVLKAKFGAFRLPKLTDLSSEEVNREVEDGKDGCFAIENRSDFNGDGRKDVAALLKSKTTNKLQLVVALQKPDSSWEVSSLPTFCDDVAYCYVQAAAPGIYKQSNDYENPQPHPRERRKIISKYPVISSGKFESTEVVYAYSSRGWRYVWTAN